MLCASVAKAQPATTLSFDSYFHRVCSQNLPYAAERLNVSIAEAEVRAAAVFSDPSLSVEYAYNDDRAMQMGQGVTVELSKNFAFGRRRARVDLTRSEQALSKALFDDYLRTLRAESALLYIDVAKQRMLYDLAVDSYQQIREMVVADSLRFALGQITEVDLMQSRIECGVSRNEMLQAYAQMQNACNALTTQFAAPVADTLYLPDEQWLQRRFCGSLGELRTVALDSRSDLVVALKNTEVAQRALHLEHKERGVDFDVSVGYNYNTEVKNEIAPAPKFSGVTVGVSIPLKWSNLNKGSLRAAQLRADQAELQYQQAQVEVQSEVVRAYNTYCSACDQVEQFNAQLLEQAQMVLRGKSYGYSRGESSLLELLDARRTYNDIRSSYITLLCDCAEALVQLESSVGKVLTK
jgi:cobalt-zinc-cadmium efflux system outer membrane protein